MSADAPKPPPPEIPETPNNGSSQGDDEISHTTMEDIDTADSYSSGPEGEVANSDAPAGPQEPVNGDGETANPGADADGSDGPEDPGESADSGFPGHDETRHVAAEDIDAVDDADNGVHDGDAGSHPLQSEDPLPVPEDDGAATGPDPGVPEDQGKRNVESNGTDEVSVPAPETAADEKLAVPEKDAEAARHESDEDVTGRPSEEPTDRPEPGDASVEVQGGDDSRPAEIGEPNDAPGPFEVTEPEEPLDAGAPMETAVSDAAPLRSEAGDVSEHQAREGDASDSDEAPTPAEAPGQESESSETDVPVDEAASESADESDRADTQEALDPEDVSKRIDGLDDRKGGEGHAPGRHLDVTDKQLTDRLGTPVMKDGSPQFYPSTSPNYPGHLRLEKQKDPLTGDTTDGVHGGDHRCGPYATRFESAEDMVRADSYFRERFNETGVPPAQEVPIKDVLGEDAHERCTGYYLDPSDPSVVKEVDFEGGSIKPVYHMTSDGGIRLHTMYPNPRRGRHP